MTLTDFQKQLLVALVRSRVDGGSHYLTLPDLADRLGVYADAVGEGLGALGDWFAGESLPDLTSIAIAPEHAGTMVMLPAKATIDRLGGEANAREEANRVRDFDWQGWLDA